MPYGSDEFGRAIFEESGDALFLVEPETDQLLDVNRMAEQLSGFARGQLLAKPMTYWFHFGGVGKRTGDRLHQAANKSGVFHSQEGYYLRTPRDGVWVPVNLTVARLHLKPRTLALITARDLSAQRETFAQLQKAEAELRRVLAAIPDGLWSAEVDAAGHWYYRYFSPVIERILGQPTAALLGGLHHWRELVLPEDRPLWDQTVARLRRGQSAQHEYRLLRPDGEFRWVRESVSVSRDENGLRLDGVLTDVTEARLTSEEHDRLFELSLDMLCVAGFDGYFKRVNPAWEKTLGWSEEELLSQPYVEFVHPDDREATFAEASKLTTGEQTVYFENRYRCPDGSYRWLQWGSASVPSLQLIFAAARDVTPKRRAQEELRQLAADLERTVEAERQARRELQQAQSRLVQSEKLVSLGQMVAGVAHEINNPLAFVLNNLAVLRRDLDALRELFRLYQEAERGAPGEAFVQVRAYAEEIDAPYTLENLQGLLDRTGEGLRRIRQIVRDLRDFARLDERELQEADLNAGVESTVNIVRGRTLKKNVTIEADLQPLPRVQCYPAKVNQVVLNLLANAIDACPPEGRVTVRTRALPDGVTIEVEDTGPGVDPAIRDKIFDPFFTTKPPGQGTGLGLSISHGIVADHGGRLDVESPPGRGARFTVFLPLRIAAEK